MDRPDKNNAQAIAMESPTVGPDMHLIPSTEGSVQYRVYKRRFWGLAQLCLLNIVVSWSWLSFASVSTTSSQFFQVSETAISWLSTGFLFAFLLGSPFTLYVLNKYPPKISIVIASTLTLLGSWLRYAGARSGAHGNFPLVIFAQVLIGLAQPFVLASPTRYSDAWFSSKGRVSATAVASLSNPLGGALGQLISPILASSPGQTPNMVLYTAIISTVASLPAFFLPSLPPTPPSPSVDSRPELPLREALATLLRKSQFWLLATPFAIYVGAFNATSSLLNSMLSPFGFSEDQAGIAGAILIVVGLVCSAVVSPVIDRSKAYLVTIKVLTPLIAIAYLILVFAPQTRSMAAVGVIMALIGGASFSLLPCALEYLVEVTWPVSPEVSSVTAWAGGQLIGGIFIVVMDALRGGWKSKGEPDGSMKRSLVLQSVICWAVLPAPLLLGLGKAKRQGLGRVQREQG